MRKQATRPEGSVSLGLAGTAPGLVLDLGDCVVVVLPGPPRELQRLWPRALETDAVRRVLARAPGREHHVLRFFGTPESAVAEALATAGGEGDGVEVTICAREFEIHVDLFVDQGAEPRGAHVAESLRTQLATYLFGEDERSVAEIVLDLCRTRDLKLATAESCTGGMVAARLTAIPGASDVFVGSIVAYAERGEGGEPRRPGARDRRARCGVGRGRSGDGARASASDSARTSGSRSPVSRGRVAGQRRSRSASSSPMRSAPTGRRRFARSSPATAT